MQFLFDLDGTLVDSRESIVVSCLRALQGISIGTPTREEIVASIGLPISNVFEKYCEKGEIDRVIERFRTDLIQETPITSKLFPDVIPFLESLKIQGHTLSVVTNKKTFLAERVLEILKIRHFFMEIVGLDYGRPKPSPDLIKFALRNYADYNSSIMIGDRIEDSLAADSAGVKSILINRESTFFSTSGLSFFLGEVESFADVPYLAKLE